MLYSANWSGGANGWSASSQWKTLNGMLLSDGSDSSTQAWIPAPYQPTVANYAVVARIRLVKTNINGGVDALGLVARNQGGSDGYQGAVSFGYTVTEITKDFNYDWLYSGPDPQQPDVLAGFQGDAGSGWHTYRLEVKGNTVTFLIDGRKLLTVTDNSYLDAGYAGIWCTNDSIEVSNFSIIAL